MALGAGASRDTFESSFEFSLDDYQTRALDAVDAGSNVVVSSPTGSGKTIVALYAIQRCVDDERKVFYTTPLKALSNQKYLELARRFGVERVGLLTGDKARNGDAPVVVMTTEVLRNMIYTSSPALENLAYVVLDEVHYLADSTRGPVWEEVIIHLGASVRLICLSATVSNLGELAGWIESVRGPTEAVRNAVRPVKVENLYLYADRRSSGLVMEPTLVDGKANRHLLALDRGAAARPGGNTRRSLHLGRGKTAGEAAERGGPVSTPRRLPAIDLLRRSEMLPAIFFVFSRAGCDRAVTQCTRSAGRLTSSAERARIAAIASRHTNLFSDEDLVALGHAEWLAGLQAGFAAHHAGLVPPFKEAIEECFSEGLVKVVFATETLSLGINMPARTVVLDSLTKFNGVSHESLTPGEYAQLTGRAGRRGLDTVGYAVTLRSPFVAFDAVAKLVASGDHTLSSSFRPTYNMALNFVARYSPGEAHRLLELSFAQYRADAEPSGSRRHPGRSLAIHFDAILALLENLGYLRGWKLTEDGRRLSRIYSEADLAVCECLRAGLFDGIGASELAAVVSALTFEGRSKAADPPFFPTSIVARRVGSVNDVTDRLAEREAAFGLPASRQPDGGFVAFAFEWASGGNLANVLDDEAMTGGDFVRSMRQLVDLLGQIGDVAPEPSTATSARRARNALMRGVVEASFSLPEVPAGT